MVRICKFCNQEAAYKPLKEMNLFFDIYFCEPCLAEYLYYSSSISGTEEDLWAYSLYTYINEQLYRWNVSMSGSGLIWHIKEPGVPGVTPNRKTKLIKSITQNPLPIITPQNINERLRTWITFL